MLLCGLAPNCPDPGAHGAAPELRAALVCDELLTLQRQRTAQLVWIRGLGLLQRACGSCGGTGVATRGGDLEADSTGASRDAAEPSFRHQC